MLNFIKIIKKKFKKKLLSIIFFGSSVYGKGRDYDLIVIIRDKLSLRETLKINKEISMALSKHFNYSRKFDVHVFDLENFKKNLEEGSFVSGLALGYRILFDRIALEKILRKSFEELKKLDYKIITERGSFNLGKFAEIRASILEKSEKLTKNIQNFVDG